MKTVDRLKLVAKYLAVWDQPAVISDKYSEPLSFAEAKEEKKKAFPHKDETPRLSTVKEELPAKTEEVYKVEDGKAKKAQYTEVRPEQTAVNLGDWLRELDVKNITTPEELDALKAELDAQFQQFRDELVPAEEVPQMEQEVDQAFQNIQGKKAKTSKVKKAMTKEEFDRLHQQRLDRLYAELSQIVAELVASGDLTEEEANQWLVDKQNQWALN